MSNEKNPWKTISGKEYYDNAWVNVTEYQVIKPGGGEGIYGKVAFKNLAVGILPIDNEGNTWLVGQYRYTLDEYSWEMPMGGVPHGENPEEGALRELREETGLRAGKLEVLCRIHTSNSVTDEEGFVYLATDLSQGDPDFDDTEDLIIKKLPFKEALEMVMDGRITDSLTLGGILKYARILGV